jgi:hypothetical protein
MSFDILMIAVVVCGLALSVAYVGAEYRSWRAHAAAQRRRDEALRELHAASFSEQHESLLPSVVQLEGFGDAEAANPDSIERGAARAATNRAKSSGYSLSERRKRIRQRATPA